MQDILQSVNDNNLFRAMDQNMGGYWSRYGLAEGCTLHSTPAVTWIYTGLQFSLFNGVTVVDTDADGVKQTVEGLRSHIATRPAPVLWWISPQSRPDNIGSLLEQHGLQAVGEVPAMAMPLEDLDDRLETIPGFTVERVDIADKQATWGRIAAIGNGCSDDVIREMSQLEGSIDDPRYREQLRYIGYLDGEPVASTAVVLEAGIAGVYAVATVPKARRKGIGQYLTVMPLLEARRRGYRVGILQSSSAGYSIYRRIGFKDVFKYKLYMQS